MIDNCGCRTCVSQMEPKGPKALDLFLKLNLDCPKCGDRACPHAENHENACTAVVPGSGVGSTAAADQAA